MILEVIFYISEYKLRSIAESPNDLLCFYRDWAKKKQRKRKRNKRRASPGLLLGINLPDHILHPGHEISHHAEEAVLLGCIN